MNAAKTTELIRRSLERRYKAPEWALLWEVPSRTGSGRYRFADALAMSLWPSRGLHLHGFEIKADRGDWLRELRQPNKSADIQKHCDFWWVVAEADVVQPHDAFPATWGLLERRKGGKLHVLREAPALEAAPIDRTFFAALCRQLALAQTQWVPKSSIAGEISEAVKDALERERAQGAEAARIRRLERSLDELTKSVSAFEESSGVRIRAYDGARLGEAVRIALDCNMQEDRLLDDARRAAARHRQLADNLAARVEAIAKERNRGKD